MKNSAAVQGKATSEDALKTMSSGGARFHAQTQPLPPQYASFSCQPHSVAAICTSRIIFCCRRKITPFGIQLSAASVDSPPLFSRDEKAPVSAGTAIEQRWKMAFTPPYYRIKICLPIANTGSLPWWKSHLNLYYKPAL